ncbi:cysteine hydrolase family protein [Couchioplanes azureus]|uniref:cysteine hydrolase family protein n=1 Tax=Couchioplanes caeruleus TaxID=56438 RepID=UPI001671459E|nr:isochorismatase family protein [Couchioplanes caeruleus]
MGKHAGSTTLLEIDWQAWIAEMGHDAGAADRARRVRSAARARGWPVICSRYLSADPADRPRADLRSPEASFLPGLAPEPGDPVVTKHDRDVFDVAGLPALLERLHTGHLLLTGLVTDHGVALAARSAAARDLTVTVVADACAATSARAHDRALAELRAAGIGIAGAAEVAAW